jgi:hypothetical protein
MDENPVMKMQVGLNHLCIAEGGAEGGVKVSSIRRRSKCNAASASADDVQIPTQPIDAETRSWHVISGWEVFKDGGMEGIRKKRPLPGRAS